MKKNKGIRLADGVGMVSAFQQKVYRALQAIPRGRVTTYKILAQVVGCYSAQAVGQALRRNPYAPEVPCHRVVRSDLTIGGFYGETAGGQVKRKIEMLKAEGVLFRQNGKIERDMLWVVPPLLDWDSQNNNDKVKISEATSE